MFESLKNNALKIPGLSHAARVTKRIYYLPQYQLVQNSRLDKLETDLRKKDKNLEDNLIELEHQIVAMRTLLDNTQKQLSIIEQNSTNLSPQKTENSKSDLFADDHVLDIFYANFEDKFRGNENDIEQRLTEYLPYFTKSNVNFNKYPVVDVGSGRGEFLKVLKDAKIKALGLDINIDMVNRANKKGLETKQGDVYKFLTDSESQSLGAITGFHIAEHIPFNLLFRIIKEANRTLIKDGFLILETPNPENLLVGSNTFYMDPSHLHPLPPALLEFALQTCGFRNIEIKRLHPLNEKSSENLGPELKKLIHGPRDYAVIGYK